MKFSCFFWCKRASEPSAIVAVDELPSSGSVRVPPIKLTTAIYKDGVINWADKDTKNLLFAKGLQIRSVESFVFLYDCFVMRNVTNVPNAELSVDAKNQQVRALAKDIYLKYIALDDNPDKKSYNVSINDCDMTFTETINISGELIARLNKLHIQIDKSSYTTIMSLYDEAVGQLLNNASSLGLPQRPRVRNTSIVSISHRKQGNVQMFSPQSVPIDVSEGPDGDNISWARTNPNALVTSTVS